MKTSIFISRMIPEAGIEILKKAGFSLEINPEDRVLTREELLNGCRGKDGLLCLLTDTIDREFIDQMDRLKGIATMAVGYNNIDVAAAAVKGIPVTNTPGVLTNATADLAWALLMATTRRLPEADRYLRAGEFKSWGPMLFLGGDLHGRTLGIIGAGRIGTAVALRARGFGMKIIYADPRENRILEKELNGKRVELNTLLKEADYITLHLLLTEETRRLIGRPEFKLMKNTAYLINTSRGPVVDEEALVEALQSGSIGGAGLDVFEKEPHIHPDLLPLSNVVLLPHIGSATVETRTRMAVMAAKNLVAMMKGERPENQIN
ncbi:MAG: D-glycerate dehydrogenase [Candidatus Auribacterota bacterium]|nr:D-glycerate dehydrogenase [Candidatus Auribacterota bacterium]